MTKPAHTPGPWTYRTDEFSDWGDVRAFDGLMVTRVSVNRYGRDELAKHRENGTDPTGADACLIAAAPDMLEALQLALEYDRETFVDEDWIKMNSALTKALGPSTEDK